MLYVRYTKSLIFQLKNTVALRREVERLRLDRTTSAGLVDDLDPELANYARNVSNPLFEVPRDDDSFILAHKRSTRRHSYYWPNESSETLSLG
jgi:hypothetical protein